MKDPPRVGGDFLSLLAGERVGPGRFQGASDVVETSATTVFAFRFHEGVLVAGDRRATAGNLVVTDQVDKVIELDEASVLAIAGVPAIAFEMVRVLQITFEHYRRSQLQPMSLPAKVRSLARLLRENLGLTLQGVGAVMPIFVGVDRLGDPREPEIYFYDPLGAQFKSVDFATSGSGSGSIRSLLLFQHQFGQPRPREMDLTSALRFALRLLSVASQIDTATGGIDPASMGFATIRVVRPAGVETISAQTQAAALNP